MKKLSSKLLGLVGLLGLGLFVGVNANAQDFDERVANVKIFSRYDNCMTADPFDARRIIQETNSGKRFFVAAANIDVNGTNGVVTIFSNDAVPSRNVQNVVYFFNNEKTCEFFKANYDRVVYQIQQNRRGNVN